MTDRQLQFRVGLFVIVATVIAAAMVFEFGEFKVFWERPVTVTLRFSSAPGVQPGGPVEMHGVSIGTVRGVAFDADRGGVLVTVDLRPRFRLRTDAHPRLVRSLLGDTTIEFTPGTSSRPLVSGSVLAGDAGVDPLAIVGRLDEQVRLTLLSLEQTSQQWSRVAENINGLVETDHGDLHRVIDNSADALAEFTRTMKAANDLFAVANTVLGEPGGRQRLRRSLDALPQLVSETEATIGVVRQTVLSVNRNLKHLEGITEPLARRGPSIVNRLDRTLGNLELLSGDLSRFSRTINQPGGSLNRLASDPKLYLNLSDSASTLAILLKNLEPVVRDLRVFSDKIAAHPELLGIRGALRGSAGVKNPPLRSSQKPGGGSRQ